MASVASVDGWGPRASHYVPQGSVDPVVVLQVERKRIQFKGGFGYQGPHWTGLSGRGAA